MFLINAQFDINTKKIWKGWVNIWGAVAPPLSSPMLTAILKLRAPKRFSDFCLTLYYLKIFEGRGSPQKIEQHAQVTTFLSSRRLVSLKMSNLASEPFAVENFMVYFWARKSVAARP